mmetsp:Transcript_17023/g.14962  ORF Transcript_17023/g.14962 Transcript_17023/m.14962 type:complete len:187 (+) Transcript_17023:286-846(+)
MHPKRNLHGTDNIHEFLELGFPLPYFLVFIGYTFILLIDKVMFDSHALVHDHDENKWRESFRKSLIDSNSRKRSNSLADFEAEINGNEKFEDKKDYNEFRDEGDLFEEENDDGINEQIRKYLSKADRFSAKLDAELAQRHNRKIAPARSTQMKSNTGDPNSNGAMAQRRDFLSEDINIANKQRGSK